MTKPICILGISGSLRKSSRNTGLVNAAASLLPAGCRYEQADISAFPFFNADKPEPTPEVEVFFSQLAKADALLLACPEYNFSMAPALKNALDWASREKDNHLLAGKPVAICSAGGGMGGARAQYHLRQVCVYLDLHPINKPELFARSATAFDDNGVLTDEKTTATLQALLDALVVLARKLG